MNYTKLIFMSCIVFSNYTMEKPKTPGAWHNQQKTITVDTGRATF